MFRLVKEIEVDWPVVIEMPVDGGKTAKHQIDCRFRIAGKEAIAAVLDDPAAIAANGDGDLLRRALVGFTGVQDEQGNVLPFSDETRDALLAVPYARVAIFRAYVDASLGRAAVRKN
jgi:hypothetical protein